MYVLDERLLPATGAPVQCTRCAHVFNAKPQGAPSIKEASGTQLFGLPEPPSSPKAPLSETQIFGMPAIPAAAPQPPPKGAAPDIRATIAFGMPAFRPRELPPDQHPALPPAPKPGAAMSRETQVFGGPAAPKVTETFGRPVGATRLEDTVVGAAPKDPAPAADRGFDVRRTAVFGLGPVQASPSAPSPAVRQPTR